MTAGAFIFSGPRLRDGSAEGSVEGKRVVGGSSEGVEGDSFEDLVVGGFLLGMEGRIITRRLRVTALEDSRTEC